MSGNKAILEVNGVRKRFGKLEALKGVDLAVQEGEFFGLLGPNGAGKSTCMKILTGFTRADAGTVQLLGREVSFGDHEVRLRCGLVPQEIALYDSLSPLENLKVFARLFKLSAARTRERSEQLLQRVGLWERRNDRVKDFSGGMKRRLNIITSLLHEPRVLLCDEPTVGVDPQSRNAIFEFLEALNREGLTIVYTTHYMEEAERLCSRLAIIDSGIIQACGSQSDLLTRAGAKREVRALTLAAGDKLAAFLENHGTIVRDETGTRIFLEDTYPLSRLYQLVEREGISERDFEVRKASLENVFLQLTGRQLRE